MPQCSTCWFSFSIDLDVLDEPCNVRVVSELGIDGKPRLTIKDLHDPNVRFKVSSETEGPVFKLTVSKPPSQSQ